jgi:hypothetical protein
VPGPALFPGAGAAERSQKTLYSKREEFKLNILEKIFEKF